MNIPLVIGVLLLVFLAVCVGASLDTERQRGAARDAARYRRERNAQLRLLQEERRRLRDERVRLADERRLQRGGAPGDEQAL